MSESVFARVHDPLYLYPAVLLRVHSSGATRAGPHGLVLRAWRCRAVRHAMPIGLIPIDLSHRDHANKAPGSGPGAAIVSAPPFRRFSKYLM